MTKMNLKNLRLVRGLTYREVAERVGCSKQFYYVIERNGIGKHSEDMARKIAEVLDVNPLQLYDFDSLLRIHPQTDEEWKEFDKIIKKAREGR